MMDQEANRVRNRNLDLKSKMRAKGVDSADLKETLTRLSGDARRPMAVPQHPDGIECRVISTNVPCHGSGVFYKVEQRATQYDA